MIAKAESNTTQESKSLPLFRTAVLVSILLALQLSVSSCGIRLKTSTEYLVTGNEYFKIGDYKKAEEEYRQALKQDPKSATAKNNLGVILNEQGRYDEAIAILQEAVSADPKNSIARYVLAMALTHKGDFDGAMAQAREATDLDLKEPQAYKALGDAACGKGDVKSAVEAYRSATIVDPTNDANHHRLVEVLGQADDIEGQILEENKSLELNPSNHDARIGLTSGA